MAWLRFGELGLMRIRRGFRDLEDGATMLLMVALGTAVAYNSLKFGIHTSPELQLTLWALLTAAGTAEKRILKSREPEIVLLLPVSLMQIVASFAVTTLLDTLIIWLPFAFGYSTCLLLLSNSPWYVLGHGLISLFLAVAAALIAATAMLAIRPSVQQLRLPWDGSFARFLEWVGRRAPFLSQELGFELRRPFWLALWLVILISSLVAVLASSTPSTIFVAPSLAPLSMAFWAYTSMVRRPQISLTRVLGIPQRAVVWTKVEMLTGANCGIAFLCWTGVVTVNGLHLADFLTLLVTSVASGFLSIAIGLWLATWFWADSKRLSGHQGAIILITLLYGAIEVLAIIAVASLVQPLFVPLPNWAPGVFATVVMSLCAWRLIHSAITRLEEVNVLHVCT